MLCHSIYKGPKSVLYNEETRCVRALKGNPGKDTNLILVPQEADCDGIEYMFLNNKYWVKGECEEKSNVDPHEIIHALRYNYIFCSSLNITIFNREIPCPREVIVLPANQSFKIEDVVSFHFATINYI